MWVILDRKQALYMGWKLFWMATGTRRVKITVDRNKVITMVGDGLIDEGVE